MKQLIRSLASLKLTVSLLMVIVLVLGMATIIESRDGAEAARKIYYSVWFIGLLWAYAVNLFCALIDKWPWGRGRIGFALTHGSMLVILAGAWVSYEYKIEGRLALWEGEESNVFVESGPAGMIQHTLPFKVHLDSFEIDNYQGTMRPAQFRSRVQVSDPSSGYKVPVAIYMNHEFTRDGYSLFQSSYQQARGRNMTILSVSRDPGQPIVFAGYYLLVLGMIVVLATRIRERREANEQQEKLQQRRASESANSGGGVASALISVVIVGLLASIYPSAEALAGPVPDPATVETLRYLPIQHDGRSMPLDTLAREALWNITGSSGDWKGMDPVAVVLGWTFHPAEWANERIVHIGNDDVATALGLPLNTKYSSYRELVGNSKLRTILQESARMQSQEQPLSGLQKDVQKLDSRLDWAQKLQSRVAIRTVPVPGNPGAAWTVPSNISKSEDLKEIPAQQRAAGTPYYPSESYIKQEVLYNKLHPTRLAWLILVPATLASLLAWRGTGGRWLERAAMGGLIIGFAIMVWGIALRWATAGRIPASNMYESLLFLGCGVGLFALVASFFLRNKLVILNATAMSALTMVLVDLLPIDPFIHPMPPVLSGTPWLAIHVPIIMVSYSVFALGVLMAHMQIGVEIFAPGRRDLSAKMFDLLYWYMHVGAILLIAGILTGSIWAASSWGRYWGWDPKEVWSLIAFLSYMGILHGRLERLIGPFGVAAISIVAFGMILMTYIGVNYVLASGLHSYGFGGSSVVNWMVFVGVVEALFLTVGAFAHARRGVPAESA